MAHAYLKNVATLRFNADACVGCGMCADVCPHGVFAVNQGKASITALDSCMECGACAKNCPASAISVNSGVGCATAQIRGLLYGVESCDDCC